MFKIYDNKGEFKKMMNLLLEEFKNGQIVEKLSISYLKQTNIPSDGWSRMNKILMMISGTYDARNYNDWLAVGRQVQKGVKAFYIRAPCFKEIKEFNKETGKEEIVDRVLYAFRPQPEYRIEDTKGKDVEYTEKLAELPTYQEIAKTLNIKVTTARSMMSEYGSYSSNEKLIRMSSNSSHVFFHELAHGAHDIYLTQKGKKLSEQDKKYKEIVAEFGGLVLARVFGYELSKEDKGFCQEYLKGYIKTNDTEKVHDEIKRFLSDVDGILSVVLKAQKPSKKQEKLITVKSK